MIAEKETFFEAHSAQRLALTYDDVRLETAPSDISPQEVSLTSRFSKNVGLQVPFTSAAMDTVTEAEMAIAMAKMGGLGVIHAGLEPVAQRDEARRVKLHLNGLIEKPVTVNQCESIQTLLNSREVKGFDFHTFPVVDSQQRLVGLLTQNDFDFAEDINADIETVMTPFAEVTSAPVGTSLREAYVLMQTHKKKTLPLVDKDGRVAGLYIWSDVKRIVTASSGLYNVDANGRLIVAVAVPTDQEALERVSIMRKYIDVVVIDSAQGDSKYAIQTLEKLKEEFNDLDVVVGNISSRAAARRLADAGADGIKVGQGPGSICTTRRETGIGCPQVTAVYECFKGIESSARDVPICADGGIKEHGDPTFALASGADSVMMGGKLAGTDESPGNKIRLPNGSLVKEYRGMGSPGAIRDSAAARKRYGSDGVAVPLYEGVEARVPYEGSVVNVLGTFVMALRKSLSYVGAGDIATHRDRTLLWRITNAGLRESHPHDVEVISK